MMVMNTPGGNTVSTAQLAMSLLCSLARNIPAADMSVKEVSYYETNGYCSVVVCICCDVLDIFEQFIRMGSPFSSFSY